MAGAGGRGFIFVVTKEPNMVEKVKELIKEKQVTFRLSDKILFFSDYPEKDLIAWFYSVL